MNFSRVSQQISVGMLVTVMIAGCGGGSDQKPTAKVKGKVTFNGQPVVGGNITFSPVAVGKDPGKSGSGTIGADGSYTMTTYEQHDGAVVGKHRVTFIPPVTEKEPDAGHSEATAAAAAAVVSPFAGLVPKTEEVEVKAGDNSLEIELTKRGP